MARQTKTALIFRTGMYLQKEWSRSILHKQINKCTWWIPTRLTVALFGVCVCKLLYNVHSPAVAPANAQEVTRMSLPGKLPGQIACATGPMTSNRKKLGANADSANQMETDLKAIIETFWAPHSTLAHVRALFSLLLCLSIVNNWWMTMLLFCVNS